MAKAEWPVKLQMRDRPTCSGYVRTSRRDCEVVMPPSMTHLIVTQCVCKQCVPGVALGLDLFVNMVKESHVYTFCCCNIWYLSWF